MGEHSDFYSVKELAEKLDTSESSIRRMKPPSYKIGGLVKYRKTEIEQWLLEQKQ